MVGHGKDRGYHTAQSNIKRSAVIIRLRLVYQRERQQDQRHQCLLSGSISDGAALAADFHCPGLRRHAANLGQPAHRSVGGLRRQSVLYLAVLRFFGLAGDLWRALFRLHDFLLAGLSEAAAERIVGLVVERNVEHRAEVEVETEQAQQLAGQVTVPFDQTPVAALPELPEKAESGEGAASTSGRKLYRLLFNAV